MGQATIQSLGLLLLCMACNGFVIMEDLPVVGNGLNDGFPSVHVISNDALLQSKYNLPVMNLGLSPPTQEYQAPLVQELLPPVHSFQHIPIMELRPPTVEYQPPVVKFNWKKRVVFPDPSAPVKVPQGTKGITNKVVTPKARVLGASSSSAWWSTVPVVNRHLQPPTENFSG